MVEEKKVANHIRPTKKLFKLSPATSGAALILSLYKVEP